MQAVRPVSDLGQVLGQGATHVGRRVASLPGRILFRGGTGLLRSAANPALAALELQEVGHFIQEMRDINRAEAEQQAYSEKITGISQRLRSKGATNTELHILDELISYGGGVVHIDDIEALYDRAKSEPGGLSTVAERWAGTIPTMRQYISQPTQPSPPQSPKPVIPGGYVPRPGEPGYQGPGVRPMIAPQHAPSQPITPTHTWKDTYREVFGENYQPGLEPIRADVRSMPVSPPETMTVYSGIFRDPRYNPNLPDAINVDGKRHTIGTITAPHRDFLPTNHPQYEASRGRTFRIRPVHQVLTDAANRAQSRQPTGTHASPVGPSDTSLIVSKRSSPIQSPLARRM